MMMKTHKPPYAQAGFSVVELSVVLTIMALIVSTSMFVGASRIEAVRVSTTQERMDFIFRAIQSYVDQYGYVPCPANNRLSVTDNNFGDGEGSGGDVSTVPIVTSDCTAAGTSIDGSTNIMAGLLPTQQLGISPALAFDGWNRRFTYMVDADFTYTSESSGAGWVSVLDEGEIQVRYANEASLPIITSEAVVALVSHGNNGHGARTNKEGTAVVNSACGNAAEDQNALPIPGTPCGTVPTTIDSDIVQGLRTQDFDDMVDYRLRWQLNDNND